MLMIFAVWWAMMGCLSVTLVLIFFKECKDDTERSGGKVSKSTVLSTFLVFFALGFVLVPLITVYRT